MLWAWRIIFATYLSDDSIKKYKHFFAQESSIGDALSPFFLYLL